MWITGRTETVVSVLTQLAGRPQSVVMSQMLQVPDLFQIMLKAVITVGALSPK